MKKSLDENKILYGYFRAQLGSDKRNKYALIKWIGDGVRPMLRAKALEGSKKVVEIIKVFHIELSIASPNEISNQIITDRLKAAAGANYDKEQNSGAASINNSTHEFGNYKRSSRDFFKSKESEGNLKKVVYDDKPMARQTPVDLGGRQMTAGAATAKANTVDLVIRN
eukprot:Partr_v1_DN25470_c0_g1_i3_m53394 putative Cofilin tropomyosin-type actin-binding protein